MKHYLYLFIVLALAIAASSCVPPPENDDVVVENYVPPPWAPPYDNVSTIRYYYLPDYEMYYDVWDRQFWYMGDGGVWVSSGVTPPQFGAIDLGAAFCVLIDRDINRPWLNHAYYLENYPRHGYDHYTDIVVKNRIVTNIEPGHELVPRAFNENNNRVTFMQKQPLPAPPQPPAGWQSGAQAEGHPGQGQLGAPPVPPQPVMAMRYHQVVHEVPMKTITPSMPAESRGKNYSEGYSKARAPQNNGGNSGGNDHNGHR